MAHLSSHPPIILKGFCYRRDSDRQKKKRQQEAKNRDMRMLQKKEEAETDWMDVWRTLNVQLW